MTEALALAMHRPSSLDDDLYQWSLDAAEMLRKQDAAIRQLREALTQIMERDETEMLRVDINLAKAALAATEEWK